MTQKKSSSSFQPEYGESRNVRLVGQWFIKQYRGDAVVAETSGYNVVTENALDFFASFLASAAATASTFTMQYVAIGTDSTTEAASNTALGSESARTTGTASYVSNAIYRVTATFASGVGTGAIVEYGIFSSPSGGTMLNRDTEAVINKGANDTLVVQADLTIT